MLKLGFTQGWIIWGSVRPFVVVPGEIQAIDCLASSPAIGLVPAANSHQANPGENPRRSALSTARPETTKAPGIGQTAHAPSRLC